MKPVRTLLLTAALGLTVAACGSVGPAASKGPRNLSRILRRFLLSCSV
jgi:hypothetical protein